MIMLLLGSRPEIKSDSSMVILIGISGWLKVRFKRLKNLLTAIQKNPKEHGAYYELSKMLKTTEDASELLKAINSTNPLKITGNNSYFIEFAISNCFHKTENYDETQTPTNGK